MTQPGGSVQLNQDLNQEYFSCIWIIRSKQQDYWTHIYLRIEDTINFDIIQRKRRSNNINRQIKGLNKNLSDKIINSKRDIKEAQLIIYKESNSKGEILKHIRWPGKYKSSKFVFNTVEYIIPIQSAYYIRFYGQLPSKNIILYLIYSFYKEFSMLTTFP